MNLSDHNSPRGNRFERASWRMAALALLVVAALGGLSTFDRLPTDALGQTQGPARPAHDSSLLVFSLPAESGPHPLIVVDPATRVMSVYHVDRATGELSLKSVRNVQWDLLMEDFNSGVPKPHEIRGALGRR